MEHGPCLIADFSNVAVRMNEEQRSETGAAALPLTTASADCARISIGDDLESSTAKTEMCGMCRRTAPVRRMVSLLGRRLCFDCLATCYDEDAD